MRFVITTTLLAIIILTTSDSMAQDVRGIRLDTVTGYFRATPIGVEDMRYIGDRYITGEDSSLMRYVTSVVQRDIDFYADFDLVQVDQFYLTT